MEFLRDGEGISAQFCQDIPISSSRDAFYVERRSKELG
jgi:hypothetical protein